MKKNNQKGITLIALVVTIIVLLILAGVSIAMLTGEGGIMNRATKAGAKTRLADSADIISYDVSEAVATYFDDRYIANKYHDDTAGDEALRTAVANAINNANLAGGVELNGGTAVKDSDLSGANYKITLKYDKYSITATLTDANSKLKPSVIWDQITPED